MTDPRNSKTMRVKGIREFLALFCKYRGAKVSLDIEVIESEPEGNPRFILWYNCEFKSFKEKTSVNAEFYSECTIEPSIMGSHQDNMIRARKAAFAEAKVKYATEKEKANVKKAKNK